LTTQIKDSIEDRNVDRQSIFVSFLGLLSSLWILCEFELEYSGFGVSPRHLPDPMEAYQWEDIWCFEGNVIEGFAALLPFGITRDNIFRDTPKFLEGKAHTALVGGAS
jgi:hypothetical protein